MARHHKRLTMLSYVWEGQMHIPAHPIKSLRLSVLSGPVSRRDLFRFVASIAILTMLENTRIVGARGLSPDEGDTLPRDTETDIVNIVASCSAWEGHTYD